MHRLLLAALFGALAASPAQAQETTVIVVRHAERAAEPTGDPVLTAAGTARAEALREAVRRAGVTHVLVTTLQRTALTAAPTAAALGLTPVAVNVRSPNHIAEVVDSIRARAGGVILVVGHSNTVPEIVKALGGQAPEICDEEYDNLYVVTLPSAGGQARVIRGRFGVATAGDARCGAIMVPVRRGRSGSHSRRAARRFPAARGRPLSPEPRPRGFQQAGRGGPSGHRSAVEWSTDLRRTAPR